MNADLGWRVVSTGQRLCTDRLPVPGGWLYRTTYAGQNELVEFDPRAVTTTFVPDSGKDWQAAYSTYQRVTQQEGR